MQLTKTDYCNALLCPAFLWLNRYCPELYEETENSSGRLEAGYEVEEAARGLFPESMEIPFGEAEEMAARTRDLIGAGQKVLYQATFATEELLCRADIIKVKNKKSLELYEIKSSSTAGEEHLDDLAFQVHVILDQGYSVEKACLVHINTGYVRGETLDLCGLFAIEDLTREVYDRQEQVRSNISRFLEILKRDGEPRIPIGEWCLDGAQIGCGYFRHCGEDLPFPSVFNLAGMFGTVKCNYHRKGLDSFRDLYDCDDMKREKKLTSDQRQLQKARIQIEHELFEKDPEVDRNALSEFLKGLHYPLYFLDFESFSPAIPLYPGTSPYQQIPFQYSLHYITEEGGPLEHREFLAEPEEDPRRDLAESLCRDIPAGACILAYNMGFEKGRIRALAEAFPDLRGHLMALHENIRDLMEPFRKRQYYTRAMKGSYSIKYVLPAMFPEDPEMDYHRLRGVHNGTEAAETFSAMKTMKEQERKQSREDLLNYCGLDTLAMVRVWEKLSEIVENDNGAKPN